MSKNTIQYVDIAANMQVIGCVYQKPSLIDNELYSFTLRDFTEEFHKVVFGSIYNLYKLGAENIDAATIEHYLEQRPQKLAVFQANKGSEYLEKLKQDTALETFNYYYHRMKKFSILRAYNNIAGMDLSWLYDINNIFDQKKKQKQEDWLDNSTEEDIDTAIQEKITEVRIKTIGSSTEYNIIQAGEGMKDLFKKLQTEPDVGYPMVGDIFNSIFRGQRLKKFYLSSAPTGFGKSRTMVANCCNTACGEIFDTDKNEWIQNMTSEPCAYITTEQDFDEVQTMMWSFISSVPENRIRKNLWDNEEKDRVLKAIDVIEKSPLYIQKIHDFSLKDIENSVRLLVKKYNVRYVYLDYIHTSMKLLSEISANSAIKGLREDNMLFMMSNKLKNIADEYGVFIMSATQLNGDYRNATVFDQNLLRGAKSIADKIDAGYIILHLNEADKEALKNLCSQHGYEMPNVKVSIYKNRGGEFNYVFVWCQFDLGTCRMNPLFCTTYDYELVDIPPLKINVTPRQEENNG